MFWEWNKQISMFFLFFFFKQTYQTFKLCLEEILMIQFGLIKGKEKTYILCRKEESSRKSSILDPNDLIDVTSLKLYSTLDIFIIIISYSSTSKTFLCLNAMFVLKVFTIFYFRIISVDWPVFTTSKLCPINTTTTVHRRWV